MYFNTVLFLVYVNNNVQRYVFLKSLSILTAIFRYIWFTRSQNVSILDFIRS